MIDSTLKQIQSYCKDKRIIIVGNSSSVLRSRNDKFIEGHDIVVRMNWAAPVQLKYHHMIGKRTDIYIVGISRSAIAEKLIKESKCRFALRLNPHGECISSGICYNESPEKYSEIKSQFNEYKPSTGSLAIKFFKDHIDYKQLSIFGYDYFESMSSSPHLKNEFKSFKYKDHCSELEAKYIKSQLDTKTFIY